MPGKYLVQRVSADSIYIVINLQMPRDHRLRAIRPRSRLSLWIFLWHLLAELSTLLHLLPLFDLLFLHRSWACHTFHRVAWYDSILPKRFLHLLGDLLCSPNRFVYTLVLPDDFDLFSGSEEYFPLGRSASCAVS